MKNTNGWIKIHRSILDHWVFKNDKIFVCWLECLFSAAHGDMKTITTGGKIIHLKPGQFVTGRHKFAANLGISPSMAWRYLHVMKSDNMLDIKSTPNYSLITIINWSKYQYVEQQSGQQMNTIRRNIISIADKSADREKKQGLEAAESSELKEAWNFEDYREKLRSSKQRHLQVIGLWWLIRAYTFPSKAAAAADIKRWLRVAQSLAAWTDADITNTANWLRDQDLSYTLETIGKHIVERRSYRGNGGATAPGEAERTTGKSTAQLDFERKGWDWGRYVAGEGYWRIDGTKV